jgi:hypothetical protein
MLRTTLSPKLIDYTEQLTKGMPTNNTKLHIYFANKLINKQFICFEILPQNKISSHGKCGVATTFSSQVKCGTINWSKDYCSENRNKQTLLLRFCRQITQGRCTCTWTSPLSKFTKWYLVLLAKLQVACSSLSVYYQKKNGENTCFFWQLNEVTVSVLTSCNIMLSLIDSFAILG